MYCYNALRNTIVETREGNDSDIFAFSYCIIRYRSTGIVRWDIVALYVVIFCNIFLRLDFVIHITFVYCTGRKMNYRSMLYET